MEAISTPQVRVISPRLVEEPQERSPREEVGYIYIHGNRELRWFKIGRSVDVNSRIRAIETPQPPFRCDYTMILHTLNMVLAERLLHCMHAEFRTNGEWFRLSEEAFACLHAKPIFQFPLTCHAGDDDCFVCVRLRDPSRDETLIKELLNKLVVPSGHAIGV